MGKAGGAAGRLAAAGRGFALAEDLATADGNGRRGKQHILYLKCQACGGCRTSRYGTSLYWLKTPLARIAMVMTALSEGVDISAASRIFGHHHTTITRWRWTVWGSCRWHMILFYNLIV